MSFSLKTGGYESSLVDIFKVCKRLEGNFDKGKMMIGKKPICNSLPKDFITSNF